MTSRNRLTLSSAAFSLAVLATPFFAHAAGIESLRFLGNISVQELIARVIRGILGLTGVFGLAFFVYGGVIWMTAQGNDEKIKKAKNTIIWATIGLFATFCAYAGVEFVFSFLK